MSDDKQEQERPLIVVVPAEEESDFLDSKDSRPIEPAIVLEVVQE